MQLLLVQREEDVGLVLGRVYTFEKPVCAILFMDTGVMAGGNVVGVQGNGALEKERELDLIVAGKAGVRGASPGVFVTKNSR